MKKIKFNTKLSLNKTAISKLNSADQLNVVGGKGPALQPATHNIICGNTRGCDCGTSVVLTCGIYCPDDTGATEF